LESRSQVHLRRFLVVLELVEVVWSALTADDGKVDDDDDHDDDYGDW
jgi:hypothetical protein